MPRPLHTAGAPVRSGRVCLTSPSNRRSCHLIACDPFALSALPDALLPIRTLTIGAKYARSDAAIPCCKHGSAEPIESESHVGGMLAGVVPAELMPDQPPAASTSDDGQEKVHEISVLGDPANRGEGSAAIQHTMRM